MWFHSLLASWKSGPSRGRRPQPPPARLVLEHLEDRMLPSNYSAASVSDLVADINAANTASGANTITLTAATSPYVLTAADNKTHGFTGLPVITGKDKLTIIGNGATIEPTTSLTGSMRFFDFDANSSLTLENLTLQGGGASGQGKSAEAGEGGAIYSKGALTLIDVTVQNNIAQGNYSSNNPSGDGAGGGIYSSGTLTLEGSTIQNNQALGSYGYSGLAGGNGLGGGVYIADGTAILTGDTVLANVAGGGDGGRGGYDTLSGPDPTFGTSAGNGLGGGLYVAGGTVALNSDLFTSNVARGGAVFASNTQDYGANVAGNGGGGALFVSGGTVTVVNSTLTLNTAQGGNGPSSENYGRESGLGGGCGFGGGMELAGGTVTLSGDIISSNLAQIGNPSYALFDGSNFSAYGGGLYITNAAVYIDAFTLANDINNTANTYYGGSGQNIYGTYIET